MLKSQRFDLWNNDREQATDTIELLWILIQQQMDTYPFRN